uniref:Uncharacterized protein n=1 Tax=Glossina pallidipes TaxID=7398 RepID=A0A1B0AEW3_GLOPL
MWQFLNRRMVTAIIFPWIGESLERIMLPQRRRKPHAYEEHMLGHFIIMKPNRSPFLNPTSNAALIFNSTNHNNHNVKQQQPAYSQSHSQIKKHISNKKGNGINKNEEKVNIAFKCPPIPNLCTIYSKWIIE